MRKVDLFHWSINFSVAGAVSASHNIGYMPGRYYNNLRKAETIVKEKILKQSYKERAL